MHWFVVKRGSHKFLESTDTELQNKWMTASPPNFKAMIKPKNRQLRLYSIIVPEEFREKLEDDLSPYNSNGFAFKNLITSIIRVLPKLKKVSNKDYAFLKKMWREKDYRLAIPQWRHWMFVFVLGYEEFLEGDKKMNKLFVAIEGERKYQAVLLDFIESRNYVTDIPNKPSIPYSPVVKEWRLYDITTFSSNEAQLLTELAPYTNVKDLMGPFKIFYDIGMLFGKLFGLKPAPKTENRFLKPVTPVNQSLNVYILGRKKDKVIKGIETDYEPIAEQI